MTVSAATSSADSTAPLAKTAAGAISGLVLPDGVHTFEGVPFAQPPVGDLRWREPQPLQPWTGVRAADHFAPRPMQLHLFGDMRFRSPGISEDCLYLNIWTPADARPGANLPVLLYYFGGGYAAGDSSEWRYDGASLARRGIVVVTCNYRLGIFGFFAHPQLTAESPHHASGNYGLLDQSAALVWVRQNIAGFGGNPEHITIAGESAGSFSVCLQMASPLSRELIAGAIGQSGGLPKPSDVVPLATAEQAGAHFAEAIGAPTVEELRHIPADQLLNDIRKNRKAPGAFPLVVDGYFLPQPPADIYAAGEQAHVPLLVGTTQEEMGFRPIIKHGQPTLANFVAAVRRLYGSQADEILRVYHADNDEQARAAAIALGGDRTISFGTWKWAELATRTGGEPVYRYIFDRPRPPMQPDQIKAANTPAPDAGPSDSDHDDPSIPHRGAAHSWDIEYVLGNLATNPVYQWTPGDFATSEWSESYFANFIKTGNPNGPGLPRWPQATGDPLPIMHLDLHPQVHPELHRDRYLLLDRLAVQPTTR